MDEIFVKIVEPILPVLDENGEPVKFGRIKEVSREELLKDYPARSPNEGQKG